MSAGLLPGFADPVRDGQAVFRAVLDATARPGRIMSVPAPALSPAPLDRATAAVLLTLTDGETTLWLDQAASAAGEWIAFHCGAVSAALGEASFALALEGVPLSALSDGTDEEPEGSATLIRQVAGLGEGRSFTLSGPGLPGEASLRVAGLEEGFAAEWAANRRRFPRGVDVILCAGDRLAALPRTTRLEAG